MSLFQTDTRPPINTNVCLNDDVCNKNFTAVCEKGCFYFKFLTNLIFILFFKISEAQINP